MLGNLGSGWKCGWRDRRGAAAVEFAMIAPLFTFLLLGAIEFGGLFFAYSAMQRGATVATRNVAVNAIAPGAVEGTVRDFLPSWVRGPAVITVTQSHPDNATLNRIRTRVVASSLDATPLPLFTRISPWTITADVTIKQELPYVD